MHEYLGPLKQTYGNCRRCKKRSAHICVKCFNCYTCHPEIERLEKKKLPLNIGMGHLMDIENLPLSS